MRFGAMIATKIDDWQILPFAESIGFESGWVPDSQMIGSGFYAVLALAAVHTSTMRLGTGVAVAGTCSAKELQGLCTERDRAVLSWTRSDQ